MRNSQTQEMVAFRVEINRDGNWNRGGSGPKVLGKTIANVWIGGERYSMTHKEIFELVDGHLKADTDNIKDILDPRVNTGNVTKPECSFLCKLAQFLKGEEDETA